jgi:fructose-1,6-bisphosphatase I
MLRLLLLLLLPLLSTSYLPLATLHVPRASFRAVTRASHQLRAVKGVAVKGVVSETDPFDKQGEGGKLDKAGLGKLETRWKDDPSSLGHPSQSISADPFSDPVWSTDSYTGKFKKKKLQTFSRFLEVQCWKSPELRKLQAVFSATAKACIQISNMVSRAQTDDMYGEAVDKDGNILVENVQGEVQQKLDVICNEIMLRAFCGASDSVAAVASEEEDDARLCSTVIDNRITVGEYVAVFDPIDGSKNLGSSLPVGTIFGIYKYKNAPPAGTTSFLQSGDKMIAAGYALYSATTVLVLTLGNGVDGFTLDPDKKEFFHTHADMRIPSCGPLVCFNEGIFNEMDEEIQEYLTQVKSQGMMKADGTRIKASGRYVGALVADAHNVLINGGLYGYPGTRSKPNGKIRLMYESNPMAFIMEQAGGAGSTGRGRIMDLVPTEIHQRTPTFLGSVDNIYELEQCVKYYGDGGGKGTKAADGK